MESLEEEDEERFRKVSFDLLPLFASFEDS